MWSGSEWIINSTFLLSITGGLSIIAIKLTADGPSNRPILMVSFFSEQESPRIKTSINSVIALVFI